MQRDQPSVEEIQACCGPHAYNRGLAQLTRGVRRPRVGQGVLFGQVEGGGRYGVQVRVEGGRIQESACDCEQGEECQHVATLLLYWRAHSRRFERTAERFGQVDERTLPRFHSRDQVRDWARELGVEDALREPVRVAFSYDRFHHIVSSRAPSLHALLALDSRHLSRDVARHCERLRREATERLLDLSEQRERVVRYNRRAERWRAVAPAEAALRPLWQRLRAVPAPQWPHAWGLEQLPQLEGRVSDAPATLRIKGHAEILLQGREPLELPLETVAAALDLLCAPKLGGCALRRELLRYLSIPGWLRILEDMDRVLAPVPEIQDPQGRRFGWRLDLDHRALLPVWTRAYKSKQGMRTWKAEVDHALSPQDRRVQSALSEHGEGGEGYKRRLNRSLTALIGHPRVVGAKGAVMQVLPGASELSWVPGADASLELVLQLQGQRASAQELAAACSHWSQDSSYVVRGEQLLVLTLSPQEHRLLSILRDRGGHFPPQAREAVMQRLDAFAAVVPMRLEGALRGVAVAGDVRPLLRLTPEAEGGLSMEVLARPFPQANAWPPGVGPSQVYRVHKGRREFATRDMDAERAGLERTLAHLELQERLEDGEPPRAEAHRVVLYDPQLALALVERLRGDVRRFQLEWTRAKPRITRPATAQDLKLRGSTKRDWFGLEGGVKVEGLELPLAELLAAVRGGRRYVSVGSEGWVSLSQELQKQLLVVAALAKDHARGVHLPLLSGATMEPLQQAGADIDMPEPLQLQLQRLRESRDLKIAPPAGLCATLRPYQEQGYRWLRRLAYWAPGAVLADDMGLGKTVQALALMLHRAALGPCLVVAPASVGVNWVREAERFAPSLQVRSYRGGARQELLASVGPAQVLVTSWELMTRDADLLRGAGFATVVLDEAQAIKNPGTRRARASAQLGGGFTLALTGTPVENRVGEIWSLMRTTVPGLLGSAERFRSRVVVPIERDNEPAPRRALSALIRPFLLRRLKSQVALDLPARSESVLSIELSQEERRLYEQFRLATLAELETDKRESAPGESGKRRFRVLAAMTRLRQLACHPGLVHAQLMEGGSSKLTQLLRRLMDLQAEGHKALVFSQFTTLLGLARDALEREGLKVCYLDGSTPIKKRQAQVDAFQAGHGDVFLISLKAGGTGLNLTAASYVFHLDPWWNPSVEDQATDRAHRIGQTQPVTVTRLVAVDTIEEQVLALHEDKRGLVAELLAGAGQASALSTQELVLLLQSEGEVALGLGTVASDGPAGLEAETGAAPGNQALLERYQASIQAQIDSGVLKGSTAAAHMRATRNLLVWTQAQGGKIEDLSALQRWSERYCQAVRGGELRRGKSDLKSGKAAWRRLGGLLYAAQEGGPGE